MSIQTRTPRLAIRKNGTIYTRLSNGSAFKQNNQPSNEPNRSFICPYLDKNLVSKSNYICMANQDDLRPIWRHLWQSCAHRLLFRRSPAFYYKTSGLFITRYRNFPLSTITCRWLFMCRCFAHGTRFPKVTSCERDIPVNTNLHIYINETAPIGCHYTKIK